MKTKQELIDEAIQQLIDDPHNGVHSAYWGLKNGTGEECIVCVVERKQPTNSLSYSQVIPSSIKIERNDGSGYDEIQTDVDESPPMSIRLLQYVDTPSAQTSIQELQRCQSPVIRGGSQIAPIGAQWVGTLGCAVIRNGVYGALTNWHVSNGGEFGQGAAMGQPHGQGPRFGNQSAWVDLNLSGGDNLVDAAFIAGDNDGNKIVVIPEQHEIGKIDPRPYAEQEITLGLQVQKIGRTTGYQRGKVVGIRNTSHVGYGPGKTGKFVRQIVIRADTGDFSAGGDSGSLILDMQNRPVALLFAGGGRDTIANPISFVVEKLGIQFFA